MRWGQAIIGLHTVDLPMTVFTAAHGFGRALQTRVDARRRYAHH